MNPDTNKFEILKEESREHGSFIRAMLEANNAFQKVPYEGLSSESIGQERPESESILVRPNGKPVPKDWSIFQVGEEVAVKNYVFRISQIEEDCMVLQPVGPRKIKKFTKGKRKNKRG
jgi:hypothetical protein